MRSSRRNSAWNFKTMPDFQLGFLIGAIVGTLNFLAGVFIGKRWERGKHPLYRQNEDGTIEEVIPPKKPKGKVEFIPDITDEEAEELEKPLWKKFKEKFVKPASKEEEEA